jgi:SAM-dependent methyltransferase
MIDFDSYARRYESALHRGLALSGENASFFAKGRIAWLTRCLQSIGFFPNSVLDFGCGIGCATPFLVEISGVQRIIGVDASLQSLRIAARSNSHLPVDYNLTSDFVPDGMLDLVYCNGVIHHVLESERPNVFSYMANCLRPGGMLAIYENNPWNLGARLVMKRIPFDRDTKMLTVTQMRSLLRMAGFAVIRVDYLFIFPRFLSFLRWTESSLSWLPLGAQYQILAYKPN